MFDDQSPRGRFERLFRQHHSAVRRYVRRRVPAEAVDDIVAETFLVAWRRLEQVPEEPLPWLLTVARNTAGTERRAAARRLRLWIKAQAERTDDRDDADSGSSDGRVLAALARLKEKDREALTLVAWDGLRPAEAAQVLGEPSARFRVRLHRAGNRFRTELGRDTDDQPAWAEAHPQPASKGASL